MKVYVKPEIRIERFELSKHIAACAFDVTFNNFETCVAIGDAEFNWAVLFYLQSQIQAVVRQKILWKIFAIRMVKKV